MNKTEVTIPSCCITTLLIMVVLEDWLRCKNFLKIPAFEGLVPFTIVSLTRGLQKTFGPGPPKS